MKVKGTRKSFEPFAEEAIANSAVQFIVVFLVKSVHAISGIQSVSGTVRPLRDI